MTLDLESDLRAALRAEAADAPVVTPEWPGPTIVAPAAPRPPGRALAIAAVLVLAVGAAGTVLALRRSAAPAPGTHVRPSFLRGTEVSLRPSEVAAAPLPGQVVRPGSTRAYRSSGSRAPITVYDSALNDGLFREERCMVLDGSTACLGLPDGGVFVSAYREKGLMGWVGLPADAAYVQLIAADGTASWQVPLDGNAVLPIDATDTSIPRSVVAYDADGNVVIDHEFPAPGEGSTTPPFVPGLDERPDRALELVDIGRATLRECLARISARPLPDAAWDACVDEGATAMLARNDELNATA